MPHQFNETGSPLHKNPDGRSPFRPPRSDLSDPLQIGISIVGTTALFGGAGWWLDSKFHTFPILMAIGAALGLFGIIYVTYLRLQESDRRTKGQSPDDHQPPAGEDS